jgi:hypothetical protein
MQQRGKNEKNIELLFCCELRHIIQFHRTRCGKSGAVERSRLFVLKLQFPDRFYPEKK